MTTSEIETLFDAFDQASERWSRASALLSKERDRHYAHGHQDAVVEIAEAQVSLDLSFEWWRRTLTEVLRPEAPGSNNLKGK